MIHICEVGPRDGLQNEKTILTTQQKKAMVDSLFASGLHKTELGSFVNPKYVPAMADTDELFKIVKPSTGQLRIGMVLNDRGMERALKAGVDGICVATVVSESLCQKNNRRSSQEATDTAKGILKRAKEEGLFTRIDIAPAWVCPYEGPTKLSTLFFHMDQLMEFAPDEIALCDTIGHADPFRVEEYFTAAGERYDTNKLVAHFHDTQGLGMANASAAIRAGIKRFDASIGGLGGCPFAPGARGNLATEDLVFLCHKLGLHTGIDLDALWETVFLLESFLGRPIGGQTKNWYMNKKGISHDQTDK